MYYLALRPQVVISVLFAGKLPDKLPDWYLAKKLILYVNSNEAVRNSHANKVDEIFLVELSYVFEPSICRTGAGDSTAGRAGVPNEVQVDEIDTKTITRILINSIGSKKLLVRLLNTGCTYKIEIASEYFLGFSPPIKPVLSESPTIAPLLSSDIFKPLSTISFVKRKGDLLSSRFQTLVNTVNCVGVMGKGVALSFKQAYPKMFEDYKTRCDRKEVRLAVPYLYKVNATRWVINFPTKGHWKNDSVLKDIENGLKYLSEHLAEWGVTSLAVPPLGCGNGNLNWTDVLPLIEYYLKPSGLHVEVYEPFEESKADKFSAVKRPSSSISSEKFLLGTSALLDMTKAAMSPPAKRSRTSLFTKEIATTDDKLDLATLDDKKSHG